MNSNSLLLIHPQFEPANSNQLSLWLKISEDSFSYAIVDKEQKKVIAVYNEQECNSAAQKLIERLATDYYLTLSYKDVLVAVQTENLVAVPNDLFSSDDVGLNAAYFPSADSKNVYVQPMADSQFTEVFSLPLQIEITLETVWPASYKLTQNTSLLNLAMHFTDNSLVIDFTVKSFQLVYIKQQQVMFQQSYQFDDVEELTYYLLLVVNQLHVDMNTTNVRVCGIINQDDKKWNCLKEYFKHVDFLVLQSDLDTTILEDMPAHYYTSLLSLYSCG